MASAFGDASFTFETNPAYHFEMNDNVHIDGRGKGSVLKKKAAQLAIFMRF